MGTGRTPLVLAAGFGLLALSCATPTQTRSESELLPRPGSRVELGEVANRSGHAFEVDAVALLREAMASALREESLGWTPGAAQPHFVLSLSIREYRPGNAFKRWLLPGYGSTVLAVEGSLRDAATGELAATVVHQRSVLAGGGYTIGAWRSVFGWVAEDIAADLAVRIERGGEFVVSVAPRADQPSAEPPAEGSLAVRIASVEDARAERGRIGTREAAFGVSMGDVHLSRRVSDVMREALIDDLWAGGVRVVESGEDAVVEASVRRFRVGTETTPLYWDVVGDIELALTLTRSGGEPQQRIYGCQQVERTWVWPTASLAGRVLDACLAELGGKLRSDPIWRRAPEARAAPERLTRAHEM